MKENEKYDLKSLLEGCLLLFVLYGVIFYVSFRAEERKSKEPNYNTPAHRTRYFRNTNYECEQDCSGHEAGWNWAESNDITDPGDCSGNSDSFIEGCEAYASQYYDYSEEMEEYQEDQWFY